MILREGDLFFSKGTGWISRAIMFITHGNVSHVGIITKGGPIYDSAVSEHVFSGGRTVPMTHYLNLLTKGEVSDIFIKSLKMPYDTPETRDKICESMKHLVSAYKRYDFSLIGGILIRSILRKLSESLLGRKLRWKGVLTRFLSRHRRAFICAESVQDSLANAKIVIEPDPWKSKFLTPQDFFKDFDFFNQAVSLKETK